MKHPRDDGLKQVSDRAGFIAAFGAHDAADHQVAIRKQALETALEERGREIDMYWRRATYFWTLIAVAFAGYFAVRKDAGGDAGSLFMIACLGGVFSWAWYLVNRGSKFWQENWELQVDLLEQELNGPLHRMVLKGHRVGSFHSAYPFSVTKVNQLLSLFVLGSWIVLAGDAAGSLCWTYGCGSPAPGVIGALSLAMMVAFVRFGRTNFGGQDSRKLYMRPLPLGFEASTTVGIAPPSPSTLEASQLNKELQQTGDSRMARFARFVGFTRS